MCTSYQGKRSTCDHPQFPAMIWEHKPRKTFHEFYKDLLEGSTSSSCVHGIAPAACSDSQISVSQCSPVNPSEQLQVVEPAAVTHSPPFRQLQAAWVGEESHAMTHHPVQLCKKKDVMHAKPSQSLESRQYSPLNPSGH